MAQATVTFERIPRCGGIWAPSARPPLRPRGGGHPDCCQGPCGPFPRRERPRGPALELNASDNTAQQRAQQLVWYAKRLFLRLVDRTSEHSHLPQCPAWLGQGVWFATSRHLPCALSCISFGRDPHSAHHHHHPAVGDGSMT